MLPALEHDAAELVYAGAADGAGGMLLVDEVDGTFQAGASTLRGSGSSNFLIRFDANGELQWSSKLRPGEVYAVDIGIDGAGDAIVGLTSSKGDNGHVEKLDAAGQRIGSTSIPTSSDGDLYLASAAVDRQGAVLLSGGGGSYATRIPGARRFAAWIAKFDPSGAALWQAPADPGRVAVDGAGNALTASGSTAMKLDPSGAVIWRWGAQVTGDARVGAVIADAAGRLLVAGSYLGTYDFGAGPIDSGPWPALFVAALAP